MWLITFLANIYLQCVACACVWWFRVCFSESIITDCSQNFISSMHYFCVVNIISRKSWLMIDHVKLKLLSGIISKENDYLYPKLSNTTLVEKYISSRTLKRWDNWKEGQSSARVNKTERLHSLWYHRKTKHHATFTIKLLKDTSMLLGT